MFGTLFLHIICFKPFNNVWSSCPTDSCCMYYAITRELLKFYCHQLVVLQIRPRWRVFQKSNNYKIIVLWYGCLCVFIRLGACWGQTKQNWRLLCKYQLKKISSLNSWCNSFFKKVLIINKYSCLKIKNGAFNSLMSNL